MKWILVFAVLYVHSNALPPKVGKDDKVVKLDKPLEQHVVEVPKLDTEKSVADSLKTKSAVPDVEKKGTEIVEEKGHHEQSHPSATNCDVPALRKKSEQKHQTQHEQRGKKDGQRRQHNQHRNQHDQHENHEQHKTHGQQENQEQHRNQHEPQHHNDHKNNGAAKDFRADPHTQKKNSNVRAAAIQPRLADLPTECEGSSAGDAKQVNKRDANNPCAKRQADN